MKIFNFEFGGGAEPQQEEQETSTAMDFMSNVAVGDRDLSKPYINENYVTNRGMVHFDLDNAYPTLINNFYVSSSIHATCVNFKTSAVIGGGYEWENYENLTDEAKKDLKLFEIRHFRPHYRQFVKDFIKHNRAYILVIKKGDSIKTKRIDPENVRCGLRRIFSENTTFYVSDDFLAAQKVHEIPTYIEGSDAEYQMIELRGHTGGSMTYPLPDYIGSGNWIYLDGEISYLYKQGIVNSINPSMIVKFPFDTSPEQKNKIKRMLETQGKGAKNMGRIFTFFKPKAMLPEIETVATTQNDKLYTQVSKEIKDNIAIAHQIDPAIIGVKVGGKLGNSEELKMQYQLFEKNWRMPNTDLIQSFFNDYARFFGITQKLVLKKFNIIDEEIKEVES